MDDIRIYDTDFNLLHIENKIVSSNWSVHFNSVGTFEIHLLADTQAAEIIIDSLDIENNKVPVIVQGDLQGIVTGIRLAEDFAVYGKTINWLLSRKIVPKFISSDLPVGCNPEEIARHITMTAFLTQDNFVLGEKVGLEDIDTFWRNTYNPLVDVVSEVLSIKNAGHSVKFDTLRKKWVFSVLPSNYSNTILSEANSNAFNSEYVYNINDYYNACWYEQEQEFTEGEFPDPVWTRLVKEKKTGIFDFECVVSATVESEAETQIREKTAESELVVEVCDLKFGEDYKLGDIMRVQFKKGKIARTQLKQISGINLGWENGSETKQVILKNV